MKILLLSITLVCVSNTIAAQHDKAENAIDLNEKPQMDEAKEDMPKTDETVGIRKSIQPEQPLAQPLGQNMYSQPMTNYPTQRYNQGYNQAYNQDYNQPFYPSQSYNQYPYQPAVPYQPAPYQPAPAARPLLGNKYWEYPNLKARIQNRYWNNQPQQPYYYGRNQNQQWNYQSQWSQNTKPAPVPQAATPFDSTSENYYQSEYNYGSVMPKSTGIELIPSEFEKAPGGQATRLSRARAWHNYHTGKPAWEAQRPIIQPRVYKPPQQTQPNQGFNMVNWAANPSQPLAYRTRCYQNCRRRCGLGNFKCNWNSNCGGMGCRAIQQRQNTNGQYWGAASSWNTLPNKQAVSQDITVNEPTTNSPTNNSEEKPCQWKWVENDWKWICPEDGPEEDASENDENSVIDA